MGATKEAAKRLSTELVRSLREGDGFVTEADSAVNDASREVIRAMCEEHGEAWLGKINRYEKDRKESVPLSWKWDGGLVYNFGADFVAPVYDEELVRLIRERDEAPYTSMREDATRLVAIQLRLKEIGGETLVWA